MDRETTRELDRLMEGFSTALEQVRQAPSEEHRLAAWHRVQMYGWELNEVLASVESEVA